MASTTELYDQAKDYALHLPLAERSRLASRLLESLDEGDDISAEWLTEINRRVEEIDAGKVKLIPHTEVVANVRARLSEIGNGQ